MKNVELIAPCHFGMEAVLKREIADLGYEITEVEDGKVTFCGDLSAVCRANIFLRTTERVLIKVARFRAETFEELFQGTKNVPWEEYLPEHAKFWVAKANSIKSKLFSPSDIQSIMKKAMVERMKSVYHRERFPEDGPSYALRVTIIKDIVTIGIDTSGESLHKRGYRKFTSKAPVTETLAAAILLLSPWKSDRILVDPFCGSGTFPIEAAMIGAGIAPGAKRSFAAEAWPLISASLWKQAREEAEAGVKTDVSLQIQGYDLDPAMIEGARENARNAGVESLIHLQVRDVRDLHSTKKYGFVITNPPYGERLEEKEAMPALYQEMGKAFRGLDTWSFYILTGYEDAEKHLGRKADKNRKIYNGMLKTYLYQFMGPRPPKKPREG
ncbi:MAG: class I SAM-dependent RNA methyltransferase [Lachnospiraceae bacterium]|nr:class I SAM-dependent RNA methyltransferase [Lachnospiraceae bacterium]